jgi:hypothetical protein
MEALEVADAMPKLTVMMSTEELRHLGPTAELLFGPIGGSLSPVRAQFDTGANHSCISAALAANLGPPTDQILQVAAGGIAHNVPVHRCSLEFPGGTKLDADFAVLGHLAPPHDVLIGRDILALGRFEVDFKAGVWTLQL